MKYLFISLLISFPLFTFSQINDDFEDGDIVGWTESVPGRWEASNVSPLNGVYSLHHAYDNIDVGFDQISHPFGGIDMNAGVTTWQFQVKHAYAPSTGNNWAVFLMSDKDAAEMYPSGTASGYAVGVNYSGSDDSIKLWKITSGAATEIINTSFNWELNIGTTGIAGIQVTRTQTGDWSVFVDANGGFDNLVQQGPTVNNVDYTSSNFCGICYEYSSAQDMKLWIDDFSLTGTEIIATKLAVEQQPVYVPVNGNFSLKISATDDNGNIAANYIGDVTLTLAGGSGNLSSATSLTKTVVNGIAEWNDLQYDTQGIFAITASSSGISPVTTNIIEALNVSVYLDDDFEDGDIVNWEENYTGRWESSTDQALNGSYSLKHIFDNSVSDIDIIQHPLYAVNLNDETKAWRFQIKYPNSSPSGNNNWNIFLMSDNDMTEMTPGGNINGYLVGINFTETDDILKLYEVTNGVETAIINTNFDWNNINTSAHLGMEITRTVTGDWEFKIDENGGFDNLVSYGTANDNSHTLANYFGVRYKYSSTLDQMIWLDDVYFGAEIPDTIPPSINSVETTSATSLKVTFSEDIQQASAENLSNYIVNNGIGSPASAVQDAGNPAIIDLIFTTQFTESELYTLTANNIVDISGNTGNNLSSGFIWESLNIENAIAVSANELYIYFSKEVSTTALNLANYFVNNSIGAPDNIVFADAENKVISLTFTNSFVSEQTYTVSVTGVEDIYGNVIPPTNYNFTYYVVQPYDIVINEIMCDVNPVPYAIPPYEYVEIHNNSIFDISLADWTFTIGDHTPKVFPSMIIPANGYAIICDDINIDDFAPYGTCIPILNPSDLTGGSTPNRLQIKDKDGQTIEDITYNDTWYNDPDKDDGGWSMERIDPTNLCGEDENWAASVDYTGGTPGRVNSINANNPDLSSPTVVEVVYVSSKDLQIIFSEKVEQSSAFELTNYSVNGILNPISASYDSEKTSIINIHFDTNFTIGTNTINIQNISDNCQNVIAAFTGEFEYLLIYPEIVEVMSANQLRIHFSEKLDATTAETVTNFTVNNSIGNPYVALLSTNDSSIVNLQFSSDFTQGEFYEITVANVEDINTNPMNTVTIQFSYYVPKQFDIVFNEVMADINPVPQGLPECTYVELYNTTNYDISIDGWIFQAEGQGERVLPFFYLKSGEYLVLCREGFENEFDSNINIFGLLSSSDLTTSGRNIKLMMKDYTVINELEYSNNWYDDDEKDNGGWSLEKIDPLNFCGEDDNWTASNDVSGGTPGRENSAYGSNPDNTSPNIDTVKVISSNMLQIEFSEIISLESLNNLNNFYVNNNIGNPDTTYYSLESRKTVFAKYATQFSDNQNYTLTLDNIYDNCENLTETTGIEFTYHKIAVTKLSIKDSKRLEIRFSETVEELTATDETNYNADNGLNNPEIAIRDVSDTSIVHIQYSQDFPDGIQVQINLSGITDVNGNAINDTTLYFALYTPKPGDIVINEVLFNPYTNADDFVEIYNNSDYEIDIVNLNLATYDKVITDSLKSYSPLAEESTYIKPGEYFVFTTNVDALYTNYITGSSEFVHEIPDMPTYSNDEGIVVLTLREDTVLDEFHYNEDMHFALLDSYDGVSLERINFNRATQDESNWHSASEIVGFATPGKQNSQYRDENFVFDDNINIEPEIFSPDNDGVDDFTYITYKTDGNGYVGNVNIFDSRGRLIRKLANNKMLVEEGSILWDGLDDNGAKARIGIYLVYFEMYNLEGTVKKYTKTVVVASKF